VVREGLSVKALEKRERVGMGCVGAEGTDEVTKVDICLAQWGLLHLLMAVV
jgi:hypothetical protein